MSEAEAKADEKASTSAAATASAVPLALPAIPAKYEKRKKVMYEGRVVYEWEQDLEEVNIFITPPPGLQAKYLDIRIQENHLTVGIKGNPPYLDEDLGGICIVKESFWTFEDGIIHIQLQKALAGETWPCACRGHNSELNPLEAQQVQQRILLERFQREHPGFDFSNATFSGQVPDPRAFLGGIDHNKLQGRY